MTYLISQISLLLLVAALFGLLLGWFLGRRGRQEALDEAERWRVRNLASNQELDQLLSNQAAIVANALAAEKQTVAVREQIAKFESSPTEQQIRVRGLEATLEEKAAQLAAIEAEMARTRGELAASEAQNSVLDASLKEVGASYQNAAAEKEAELAGLRGRVTDLEPLAVQVAERETRIHELEVRLERLVTEKDTEISQLCARLHEFVPEAALEAGNSPAVDATAIAAMASELTRLRSKVSELEPLTAQVKQRDELLRQQQEQRLELARTNESQSSGLQARMSELERSIAKRIEREGEIRQQHQAELQQLLEAAGARHAEALAEKDKQLGALHGRVAELSPVAERAVLLDEKEKELTALRSQIGVTERRLAELEPLPAKLAERDFTVREREQHFEEVIAHRDSEIASLVDRIGRMEPLAREVEQLSGRIKRRENELRESEARYGTALSAKDTKISEATRRVAALETELYGLRGLAAKRATAVVNSAAPAPAESTLTPVVDGHAVTGNGVDPKLVSEAVEYPVADTTGLDLDEVARIAYSYWVARGRQDGSAQEDWQRAVAEIRARVSQSKAANEGDVPQQTATGV